jgi:cytoskeletal protein RodZ
MTLEHIGQKLKTARDNLGLSLSQIHERTKIPFYHLQAIDNGQTDDLPEPVYVSGFIKRYAECVGLNGQQLVEEYREDLDNTPHANGRFSFLSRGVKDQQPVPSAPPQYFNRTKIEQPPPNLLKSVPFYAFWIAVVVFLVGFLASRQQTGEGGAQDTSLLALKDSTTRFNAIQSTAVAPSETPVAPTPTTTPAPTAPPAASNDARVTLNANKHVWVEVKSLSSGESKYTGALESGDRRDYQDPEGLRIVAGNGGSLTFEVDGKVHAFGEPGKRTEKTFLSKVATAKETAGENKPTQPGANKPTATTASAGSTTTTPKKVLISKKSPTKTGTRKAEGTAGRAYLPGENLGPGTRGIDVPYRYSE